MSKLFIYYTLSGNGDFAAECLKDNGFAIRKVETAKKPPKSCFFQILQGGFNAGRRYCEPLKPYDTDVSAFDEVVVGSPVWNGRLSCPVNTVLRDVDFAGRKVTFVLYSGSGEAKKAEEQIKKRLPDAAILHVKEPKKNPDAARAILSQL